jgi:uncharacterized membrane protein
MSSSKAAVTVLRSREEVQRLWGDPSFQPEQVDGGASVRFVDAPGDRGTEIHVELARSTAGGKLGEAVHKLTGGVPLAKLKEDLRRFKQRVEAGVIAQSDAAPDGERVERKLRERPAQPLGETEMQGAGV